MDGAPDRGYHGLTEVVRVARLKECAIAGASAEAAETALPVDGPDLGEMARLALIESLTAANPWTGWQRS